MSATALLRPEQSTVAERPFDAHVALLTNFIPPYALPVYLELAQRVRKLTILLSTPMEVNRRWEPDWGGLDVRVQRTLTVQRPWKHPTGFREAASIHIPWDTTKTLKAIRPDVILSAQFGMRSLLSARYAARTRTPLAI